MLMSGNISLLTRTVVDSLAYNYAQVKTLVAAFHIILQCHSFTVKKIDEIFASSPYFSKFGGLFLDGIKRVSICYGDLFVQ